MIMLVGVLIVCEVIWMGFEIFYVLKKVLEVDGKVIFVGDEGGFVLDFVNNEELFEYLIKVIEVVGYKFGKDVVIVFDVVVFEFWNDEDKKYKFYWFIGEEYIIEEWIEYFFDIIVKYLVVFVEDLIDENNWDDWVILINKFGKKV